MIKKMGHGYQVQSRKGKPLSKPDLSKGEAEKRLAEVEMFKHRDAIKKMMPQKKNSTPEGY